MAENKKTWVTPELIVLVRSKPEEAVLVACKLNALIAGDPFSVQGMCDGNPVGCVLCSADGGS